MQSSNLKLGLIGEETVPDLPCNVIIRSRPYNACYGLSRGGYGGEAQQRVAVGPPVVCR